ncbi:MAG: kelch repeat-containing protein [Planctomycetota bacterium]
MRILLAAAYTSALTSSASAQHFAQPDPIDVNTVGQIGTPAFTLDRPTTSFGSVSHDGWVYIMGGYTGNPHDYYNEAQSRDFYRVSLRDPDQVERLPDTEGLQSCPLEAWNGTVVRSGGMVALNARGEPQRLASLDVVRKFDVTAGTWSDLPALPEPRSSHDTAVVGSTLYVFGGWTLDPDSDERPWHDTVAKIDLSQPAAGWTEIEQPFERRALASVAVDDSIVVIGGMTSEGTLSSAVHVFDTASETWTEGPDFPGSSFGVAAEVSDGRVIASGSDGVVHAWRPGSGGAWEEIATLTFPRFFHQIAADEEGDLYFFGGISRGVRPVHVERVRPAGSTSSAGSIVANWTIPSPSPAKNRQGIVVHDGWVHTFGGNNSVGQHDFEPQNFLTDSYRLSLAGLMWREGGAMPAPRQTIQTVKMTGENAWLALGGFGHDGESARTFDQGFIYRPGSRGDEGVWTELGSLMPTPRSQFRLVQHGAGYWVFGGLDYDSTREAGDHFRHVLPVLFAEGDGDEMFFEETMIDLPTPRRAFGGAVLAGKYYLVGGMRENFQTVDTCEVFDFATGRFEPMPSPSRPRLSPTLVELGGKLYLAGGSSPKPSGDGLEPNASIEVFDPATNEWSVLVDEIPMSPRHMRMMTFRGRLLLFSTHFADEAQAQMAMVAVQ